MAIRCETCRQPLPLLPGQSADDVRCPWCGHHHAAVSQAIAPPARAATLTGPRPLAALPPAEKREPVETPPARRSLVIGGLVAGVIGLLLSVGLVVFLLTSRKTTSPEPVVQIPPVQSTAQQTRIEDSDTDSGPRQTKKSDPTRTVLPRGGNSGIVPRKPGDDIALPRMVDFMGSRASGKQICIIADCSGSMASNRRMETLKEELEKTLKNFQSDQQYYVIFFDSRTDEMPDKAWVDGGKDDEKVLRWVRSQKPRGGTLPMPAFEIAFRLQPKPELIFFMTDGIIPQNVPAGVARLNEGVKPKVKINSILFGGEGRSKGAKRALFGEDQLKQLATDSGGTYQFVPDRAGR